MRILLCSIFILIVMIVKSQNGICFVPSFTANAMLGNITLTDFNNDGIPDIAGKVSSTHVGVFFGTGTGSFSQAGT